MNLYGFVGNDGVNQWDYLGMTPGVGYVTYKLAKAEAINDSKTAGWASWNRAKVDLDKFKYWSKIPGQIHADWAVFETQFPKQRIIFAGAEQGVVHYCVDTKHYHTTIYSGDFEFLGPKVSGERKKAMIDAILAMNPGAIIEAVGHTHMVEHFETSSQTGDLRIVTVAKGLSAQDIRAIAGHAANGHIVETYAVEFDGSVDSKR